MNASPDQIRRLGSEACLGASCEIPAVTDTLNEEQDQILQAKIEACEGLAHMTLVSGFDARNDDNDTTG